MPRGPSQYRASFSPAVKYSPATRTKSSIMKFGEVLLLASFQTWRLFSERDSGQQDGAQKCRFVVTERSTFSGVVTP